MDIKNPAGQRKGDGLFLVHLAAWGALACALLAIIVAVVAPGGGILRLLLRLRGNVPPLVLLFAEFFVCRTPENQSPRRLFLYSVIALAGQLYLTYTYLYVEWVYLLAILPAALFVVGSVRIKKSTSPRKQDEEIGQ